MNIYNLESLVWNTLLASKEQLNALKAQVAESNNPVLRAALRLQWETLFEAHKILQNAWEKIYGQARKDYFEAAKMWAGSTVNLPPLLRNALRPPSAPFRSLADITP